MVVTSEKIEVEVEMCRSIKKKNENLAFSSKGVALKLVAKFSIAPEILTYGVLATRGGDMGRGST